MEETTFCSGGYFAEPDCASGAREVMAGAQQVESSALRVRRRAVGARKRAVGARKVGVWVLVLGVVLGTGGWASAVQAEEMPTAQAALEQTAVAKGRSPTAVAKGRSPTAVAKGRSPTAMAKASAPTAVVEDPAPTALDEIQTAVAKADALAEAQTGEPKTDALAEAQIGEPKTDALAEARVAVAKGLMRGAVFARGDGGAVGVVGEAAPGRPMTERTWFDVASVTKTFTAAAAALLVAEGKLVVDDRLHRLATHTTTGRFKYDCANFVELGEAVERASGMRLDVFCRERIFRPLGMVRTTWWPVADDGTLCQMLPEGTPLGVVSDWRARAAVKPIGNAGAFSDVHDLRLFVTDLLTRKTFPKAYYDLLLTCRYEEAGGIRRSFGFDMSDTKRPAGLSRATIFHSGWTGQTIVADSGTGFCGVVLTARTGDHDEAIAARNRILSALAAEFAMGKSRKENR